MARKIKKYKVGIDSETYAISLVDEPAIEADFVALAKQEEEKMQVLLESNEKHLVIGPALIPNKDIYRYDGENEYYISFTKESIEKMSQEFLKEYRQKEITLDHQEDASEICVVESWLVADSYKDKANALGLSVPEGTWMVAMKVNNIDTWERIKSGELKGFSVESLVTLEDFGKQTNNNDMIETNEMFWDKLKNALKEVFQSTSMIEKEEETTEEVHLEEQVEPTVEVQEPSVEPTVEPTVVEEPTPTVVEEPSAEEPSALDEKAQHLEELVNSLKEEIKALKDANVGLNEKIKTLESQPSAKPISTNASARGNGDSYAAWREQMRSYLN